MGDGFVLKLSESEMLLISDQTDNTSLMSKFDRHIIADDVVIEDRTGEFQQISIPIEEGQVVGEIQAWLGNHLLASVPALAGRAVSRTWLRLPFGRPEAPWPELFLDGGGG